jgi:hypothetical protein
MVEGDERRHTSEPVKGVGWVTGTITHRSELLVRDDRKNVSGNVLGDDSYAGADSAHQGGDEPAGVPGFKDGDTGNDSTTAPR